MKKIPLSQKGKNKGKYFALVDDDMFEYLNKWEWSVKKGNKTLYAVRIEVNENGKKKNIFMHRVVMNTPDGMVVDHRFGNGLDNQKENMRNCTHSQNLINQGANKKLISKYKGVYRTKITAKGKIYIYWRAVIVLKGRYLNLGYFDTPELAAIAYNNAAKVHHGEFANLNEVFCNPCIINSNNLIQKFN